MGSLTVAVFFFYCILHLKPFLRQEESVSVQNLCHNKCENRRRLLRVRLCLVSLCRFRRMSFKTSVLVSISVLLESNFSSFCSTSPAGEKRAYLQYGCEGPLHVVEFHAAGWGVSDTFSLCEPLKHFSIDTSSGIGGGFCLNSSKRTRQQLFAIDLIAKKKSF